MADFGLARVNALAFSEGPTQVSLGLAATADSKGTPLHAALTNQGAILGTPLYMSPEQHAGRAADSRSDQFSFCVALYEALYGRMPFSGTTFAALHFQVMNGQVVPPPTDRNMPPSVARALLRGLATDAAARFPSMRELLAALVIDLARDPTASPGTRRRFAYSMLATMAGSRALRQLLILRGMNPIEASLGAALLSMALCLFFMIRLRQLLLTNTFHRTVVTFGVAYLWQLITFRVGALLVNMSYHQVLTMDLIGLGCMSATLAFLILPGMWVGAIVVTIGAIVAAFRPDWAPALAWLLSSGTIVMVVVLWFRAAESRADQQATEAMVS